MNPPASLFTGVRFSSARPTIPGMIASMISAGPGSGDGPGVVMEVEVKLDDSDVVGSGVMKVGTKVGTDTIDVIVVTTPPGNGYGSCGVFTAAK